MSNPQVSEKKSVGTLVSDIYDLISKPINFSKDFSVRLAEGIAKRVSHQLSEQRGANSLRLSNLGTNCNRKLWYSVHASELGEPLPPAARLKYLFGHILEELLLSLAREAGHSVVGEQDELTFHGIKGHRDAIVDGRLVDVKSSSTYGFRKFRDHGLDSDDPFGYRTQLDTYLSASLIDDKLVDKHHASFLVIDKTLGNIVLDTYPLAKVDYKRKVEEKREVLNSPRPPDRGFKDEPDGASGNLKLGVECSYCPFKKTCWPGLRMFLRGSRPVFLTHVQREPRLEETKDF